MKGLNSAAANESGQRTTTSNHTDNDEIGNFQSSRPSEMIETSSEIRVSRDLKQNS